MRTNGLRTFGGVGIALSVALSPAGAQESDIVVTVDGAPVALSGKVVRTPDGAILVPPRGLFEKLGAGVQYSKDARALVAVRGTTTVTLQVGSLTGTVNGTPYALATPAQIVDGAILVPLRFVAQAFGGKVRFNSVTRIASVTTKNPLPAAAEPVAPPLKSPGELRGVLSGIEEKRDALTLRRPDGSLSRVALAPDPVILMQSGGGPTVRRPIDALRIGDAVTVRLDGEGRALVVEALVNNSYEAPDRPVVAPLTRPAKLEIERLRSDFTGPWAKAGTSVAFTLAGTPGAKATLTLPGVAGLEAVEMPESAPGVYSARITVPPGALMKEVRATARLTLGELPPTDATADDAISFDAAPPTLSELTPAQGAILADPRPQFTGIYADAGSGIDAKKSKLVVAGKNVTADAVFTEGFFSYKPSAPLKAGKVVATLLARDAAGNTFRKDWSFTVEGASAEPLRSIVVSPSDKTLEYGDVVTVKLTGVPGAAATFSLGDVAVDRPLREDSPGVYIGTYTLRRDDAVAGARISVRFTPPGGAAIERTADGGGINVGPATAYVPTIDAPQEGASVGDLVVLTGRALPGASVRVTLKYTGRKVVVPSSGQVASVTVKADGRGAWTTAPLALKVPRDVTGLTFTAEAVAVGAGGALSEPARVRFRK